MLIFTRRNDGTPVAFNPHHIAEVHSATAAPFTAIVVTTGSETGISLAEDFHVVVRAVTESMSVYNEMLHWRAKYVEELHSQIPPVTEE